jgi:hypothetical protein
MAVFTTVRQYLRNLLDDEDPTAYYWSDDELDSYLAHWRRSVVVPEFSSAAIHSIPSTSFAAPGSQQASDVADAQLVPSPDRKTFRAAPHLRFWASTPAPVVYVGGSKVTGDADWTYTTDVVNGSITFTKVDGATGEAVHPGYGVRAAFDYFPLYEVAFEALGVAMGQWASVQEVQTSSMRVRRATIRDAYQRVKRLRDLGQPREIARRRPR